MSTAIQIARKAGLQLMEDNATHRFRFFISGSSGNRYTVSQSKSSGQWQCSCPGWTLKSPRRDCKHLKAITPVLKQLDAAPKQLR